VAAEEKPTPFGLIVKGLQDLQAKQLAAAGQDALTMEQYRINALMANELNPAIAEETPDSTAIESFAYDPLAFTLDVKWLDSRGGASHEYLYYGVNPPIAQGLEDAASRGQYMNEVVKAGFFPFTRLS
jgi:KTSC domain